MRLLRWSVVLLGMGLLLIGGIRWVVPNPDDTYLVLESEYQFADNTYEYYLTPPDGSQRIQLSGRLANFQYLRWTGDPEWLLGVNSRTNIVTFVNLIGKEQRSIGSIRDTASGQISPDQQWLAFYTSNLPQHELIITDTQGHIQQHTSYPDEIVSNVFWSPDSQYLYVVLCPQRQPCQMFRMAIADGSLVLVADLSSNYTDNWQWSPDGQWLMGTSEGCVRCLLILSADGQAQHDLEYLNKAEDPVLWSADSQWIIYRHDDQIMRARLDGSDPTTLVTFKAPDPILFQSPDHEWVYYASGTDLHRVSVQGDQSQPVYSLVEFSTTPVWLSDNSLVLLTRAGTEFEIMRLRDDGTQIANLGRFTEAYGELYVPIQDSTWIYYIYTYVDIPPSIYRIRVDGNDPQVAYHGNRLIISPLIAPASPSWSILGAGFLFLFIGLIRREWMLAVQRLPRQSNWMQARIRHQPHSAR